MHLSIRLTDEDAARVQQLLDARGLGARGKATLIRALLAEEAERLDGRDGKPPVATERELTELLTKEARAGSVPAMRELRSILRTPPADAGGPGAEKGDASAEPKDQFDALDEFTDRRLKREAAAKPKAAKAAKAAKAKKAKGKTRRGS